MYMTSGLNTWKWITHQGPHPEGQLILPLSRVLSACGSSCRRAPRDFPVHNGMSTAVVIAQVLFRQPCCWDLMVFSFAVISRRHDFRADFWSPDTLFPPSLPKCSLGLGSRSWLVNVSIGPGHSIISSSLHVDQFWFPLMVSVCCKETILWWRARVTLTCKHLLS